MKGNICGSNIRKRRIEFGLAQVEIAAALDVDYGIELVQSDISEIERNVRGVKDFELKAISEILQTSPNDLLSELTRKD